MGRQGQEHGAALSWRRGFVRLWFALSILWILLTGAIAVAVLIHPGDYLPNSSYYFWSNKIADGPEAVDIYSDQGRALEELAKRGTYFHFTYTLSNATTLDLFFPASTSKALMKPAGDDVIRGKETAIEALRWSNRWTTFWWSLGYMFGPPIVVFILGATVAWILAGFRGHRAL